MVSVRHRAGGCAWLGLGLGVWLGLDIVPEGVPPQETLSMADPNPHPHPHPHSHPHPHPHPNKVYSIMFTGFGSAALLGPVLTLTLTLILTLSLTLTLTLTLC